MRRRVTAKSLTESHYARRRGINSPAESDKVGSKPTAFAVHFIQWTWSRLSQGIHSLAGAGASVGDFAVALQCDALYRAHVAEGVGHEDRVLQAASFPLRWISISVSS
jgi:hypothetical protein